MVKRKAAAKKAAAKKPPARAAKTKPTKPAAKTAGGKKTTRKSPEQLEVIQGVRYADLDRYCREIGDNRDEVAELKREGKTIEIGAMKAMRIHGVTGYKSAGVLLMLVQGDDSLVVKRDRGEKGSSGSGALNQPVPAPEADQGTGQDAGQIADNLTEGVTDDEG